MGRMTRWGVCVVVCLSVAGTAQAGLFKNTVRALEYAGFNFIGQKNPLSGGADLMLVRNFNNETLDFGATELTLTGPLQFTFTTGGRGLEVLDVSLSTNNRPLTYALITDVGGQKTQVNGNFLLNATGSMNSFGWYDFQFQYSVREQIIQDGRFANGEEYMDFDIGPIDISGNIFADMLAVLFDPLFTSLGTENIFASFSGRYQAMEELNRRLADSRLSALGLDSLGEMSASMVPTVPLELATLRAEPSYVPDPSTLLLLLGGAPVIYAMRRRRRA